MNIKKIISRGFALLGFLAITYILTNATPHKKRLAIGGLLFNLIGTVFLFLSVKPSENAFEDNTETGTETPMALIDKNMAKIGIGFIFTGFLFQLISIFMTLGD